MSIDIRDLLVLTQVPGIGSVRLRALVNHFKEPRAVIEATAKQLAAAEGIEKSTAVTIVGFLRTKGRPEAYAYADKQLSRLNRTNGRIITYWDQEYPPNLKRIFDPPPVLFIRGEIDKTDEFSIAVVGTRDPSSYGIAIAERFASGMAKLGITVVSGLARGIDTCAHLATLRAGGRTIAVIGSGIDVIYPSENAPLAERIAAHGAVLSECGMGAKPDAINFPRRNRIVSGLSLGTLVVETGIDGGAMITARMALDQDREVFAIPGPLGDKWKNGTHRLIKEGKALLTESVDDIVSELAPRLNGSIKKGVVRPRVEPDMTLFERRLYDVVLEEPQHIDLIADRSGLSPSDALVQLLSLEFKGIVRQLPGKMFMRMA